MDKDKSIKDLNFVVKVRVYGKEFDSSDSHSYLIDDHYNGTSSAIGEFCIDIRSMKLKNMRPIIQYDRSGHMDKRSMMFQEALFIMSRLPNHYNRPSNELKQYQFGFLKKDGGELRLVSRDDEEKPISDLIGAVDYFQYDLAIVPLSQIAPSTN